MLRTFSGRQPHPAAAAEAPQPGSDPSADAAVAPPLPERTGTPSQDADAAPDAAARGDLPAGEEPPPAGSVAAGEAAWEAQLAVLEAAKAAKRASLAAPLAGGPRSPDHEDASDSDADDAILSQCDETYEYLSNGDDLMALVKGDESSFTVLDTIGDAWSSTDPGSSWTVCGDVAGTKDTTLVRAACTASGNGGNWSVEESADRSRARRGRGAAASTRYSARRPPPDGARGEPASSRA